MVLMLLELAGASVEDLAGRQRLPTFAAHAAPGEGDGPARPPLRHPGLRALRGRHRGCRRRQSPGQAECTDCGYVYALDPRRQGGTCTLETGGLWYGLLVRTLAGGNIGVRAAGRVLGVAPTIVMRHARRLGLWREEWKDRSKLRLRREELPQRLLERHRAGWLAFRASGVDVLAKGMPKSAFNAYRYLIRRDWGWLERNHPLGRQALRPSP